MLIRWFKQQQGGIVLEAALLLPVFLTFVVGLIVCIQIAVMEMALQAGVSEATKTIAGQLYPVRLLMQEAKSHYDQSAASNVIGSAIEQAQNARDKVIGAEDLADEYAAYIPDSLLDLMSWEKELRQDGEESIQGNIDHFLDETVKPRVYAALTPIVYAFCDSRTIERGQFKVISVTLPSLQPGGNAYFSLEAEVDYKLRLPFISHTIKLRKKALERAWVGA
ncbi:TadE/TadG family type IV pilus assembly protein [Paenibacillus hexagrammi]|uniref:Pilus assembly protein n=1 Tax=Paenibacillus hexagrammi TaxID=2908839 RepID=A0ABY3SPS6_9BACL|nr:hypothetical protein [Paenibacillus sp. YPD9-1]UJF35951.1 hypothetical protein L0M14_13215 [Paenibacillus sp. YPD9-1]